MGCTNCRNKMPQQDIQSSKLSIQTSDKLEFIDKKRQIKQIKIYVDFEEDQKIQLQKFRESCQPSLRQNYFSEKQTEILSKNQIQTEKQFINIETNNIENEIFFKFGGTSSIYKAYSSKIQKHIIIKKIFLNNFSEEQILQLQYEKNFLEQNFHPNIIQYYGSIKNENLLEIQMEFASGGSLKEQLDKENYFSEQLVKIYTRQILKGLLFIHSKNYIYRDLKFENIVLDNKGNIKLIDFGAICKVDNQSSIDIGTINYQAPELFDDKSQIFERYIDIWALGCLVFEMLTGKSLFPSQKNINTIKEILSYQNLSENYDILTCSTLAKDFIQRCLEIEPQQRNNCYELLQHPFLNLLQTNQTFNDLEQIQILSNQGFSCQSLDEKKNFVKKNTFYRNSPCKKNFSKIEKNILITKARESFFDFDQKLSNKKKKFDKENQFETIESVDLIIQNQ